GSLGQRGDGPVAVARFIASQRAEHGIPQATACRALGVSPSWFYKWRDGDASPRRARRAQLTAEIRRLFAAHRGRYGSPRITADCGRRAGGSVRTPSRRSWPSSGWSPAASVLAAVAPAPGGAGGGPRTWSGAALPPGRSTASGTATAPRSPPPRASWIWTA